MVMDVFTASEVCVAKLISTVFWDLSVAADQESYQHTLIC